MSLLCNWYNGMIRPAEQIVWNNPEYRAVRREIDHELEFLKKKLLKEDGGRLGELDDLYSAAASIHEYASFAYGFKLGVLLMSEVYAGGDGPSCGKNEKK